MPQAQWSGSEVSKPARPELVEGRQHNRCQAFRSPYGLWLKFIVSPLFARRSAGMPRVSCYHGHTIFAILLLGEKLRG
jgi:hypothetical protein